MAFPSPDSNDRDRRRTGLALFIVATCLFLAYGVFENSEYGALLLGGAIAFSSAFALLAIATQRK